MRWRNAFMAEVAKMLRQLGMRACPVCGSAESLTMSPFPVLLVDVGFPHAADDISRWGKRDGDMTFAVRVECATCGHLLLFNAQKYRTGDEKIMMRELTGEHERHLEE
jgi:hypothetical protein